LPVFLERFVLPVLAAVVITVIVLNPFKFDWQQRVSLLLGVLLLAYFVGHTIHRGRSQSGPANPPTTASKTGDATTAGDRSPAITGDGNKVTYEDTSNSGKRSEPPKSEPPKKE
jgi:hypothetical protein